MTTQIQIDLPKVELKDLEIGDKVVQFHKKDDPTVAIVKNIKDDIVYFFKPYPKAADFLYTGGVICYTGICEFEVHYDHPYYKKNNLFLIKRGNLK